MMPLAFSIAEGIVMGIISFTFLRLVCWRISEIGATLWILTGLFLLRYPVGLRLRARIRETCLRLVNVFPDPPFGLSDFCVRRGVGSTR